MDKKVFSSKTYRPLPSSLTIKPSKIEGLGLHAAENLDAGIVLGKTHVMSGMGWIRTPLGGFVNHSATPNCFILDGAIIETNGIYNIGEDCKTIYTVTPIAKGEELTVYYRFKGYDGTIDK
jgi:SET domain-containing protein